MSVQVIARIRPLLKTERECDVIVQPCLSSSSTSHSLRNGNEAVSKTRESEKPLKTKKAKSGKGDDADPSTAKATVIKIPNPRNEGEDFSFKFHSVYDGTATQQEIFDAEVAPTLKHLFNGFDITLFAYGVTGTGKTHTMRGGKSLADRGVIPRLLSGIYRRCRKVERDSQGRTQVGVAMSYYEIYNDKIFDLFEPVEKRTPSGLPLRDNGVKTVVVGLTERPCTSLKEFEGIYDQANMNRSTSATKLNSHSSRSHAVLSVKLTVTTGEQVRVSTASCIDLAGSEDNRRTENGKERMVESASINRSLFVLAQCVEAINKKQARVPYRESKMTRILGLGQNNGLTIMILNLAPVRSFHLDTLSSLNFANRTKKIESREIENEPMFKGPPRPVAGRAAAPGVKRQPLRPLTASINANIAAVTSEARKTSDGKPAKAFAVYTDMSHPKSTAKSGISEPPKRKSPLKRRSGNGLQPASRPFKVARTDEMPRHGMSSMSAAKFEELVEKKVREVLSARQPDEFEAQSKEINKQVQRRLELLEQRIDETEDSRADGLSYLLMAKQHQARGEYSSALRMYQLALPFFPNNGKLALKIEALRNKKVAAKQSTLDSSSHGNEQCGHDVHEEDADAEHTVEAPCQMPKQVHSKPSPHGHTEGKGEGGLSPRSSHILSVINTRDIEQIKLLRGVGVKKAEGIVDCLCDMDDGKGDSIQLHSLSELEKMKGVGLKTVENMRNDLLDPSPAPETVITHLSARLEVRGSSFISINGSSAGKLPSSGSRGLWSANPPDTDKTHTPGSSSKTPTHTVLGAPGVPNAPPQDSAHAPAPSHGRKKRAYANQAFDFGVGANAALNQGGESYGYPATQQPQGYSQGVPYPGQQPAQAPAANYPGTDAGYQAPAPTYPPPPGPGIAQVTQQMGQMSMGDQHQQPGMQRPMQLNQLYPTDLLTQPFNVAELEYPPPPIVLPPNTSVTPSPNANCPAKYVRSTLNAVPTTNSLLKKSRLPFALVIQPYASLHDSEDEIPVVSDQVISRCRRCRSYINPFVTFLDHGHRWRCNMCSLTNDVPQAFDWDAAAQKALDRWQRPDLNHAVVEFVAPQEYMVRPPQPLVYLFLIDVSYASVTSGLLATAARCIRESLDRIPNADRRTRIGFIAVDSSLHYFTIPRDGSESSEPNMLVVSDLDEPFIPIPGELLITLAESRENVETFLDKLQEMFQNTQNPGSAMGSALRAGHQLIGPVGGKLTVLTASLPNMGYGSLEMREDKKVLGTSKESSLLQTASSFYKSFAVECSKQQISVDMFLFSSQYQDVASLSNLPRYTGGQTYFYPGWNAARSEDAIKFAKEFSDYLSAEIGLEAVLRVRATTGLRMNTFYGNFFNRSSDLCAFPAFPRDQAYVVEVAIDETVTRPVVCLQTAVLHTTCNGERRIRVLTLALPTTQNLADVYASADQCAITTYFSHKAVERTLGGGLDQARDALQAKIIELLSTYRKELAGGSVGGGGLQFPANLRGLPILFLAMMKNLGLRKSAQIPTDMRSAALCLLSTLPLPLLIQYIYPKMYSLHDMPDDAGIPHEETGEIVLPPLTNLSSERLAPHGMYLIDDGQTQFLWIGRDAVPQLINDVFGLSDKSLLRVGKQFLPETENDFNERVRAVINKSRDTLSRGVGSIIAPHLYVVKEDGEPGLRLWAQSMMVEDRADQSVSLQQWMGLLREKVIQ
ncbi:COPII subunit [Microsporum canis]